MALPQELQAVIDDALALIGQNPQYEYGPLNRKKLMDTFRGLNTPYADKVRGWLAVITARRVLPIHVEPQFPDDVLDRFRQYKASLSPKELQEFEETSYQAQPDVQIALAESVLLGTADAEKMSKLACDLHNAVGNYRKYQPVNAVYVERAANKALVEVADKEYDAFRYLRNTGYSGKTYIFGVTEDSKDHPHMVTGEQFTDHEWARSGLCDCAAAAAIAWSCNENSSEPDSEKMLEFWLWWLKEAIPQAWAKAEENNA